MMPCSFLESFVSVNNLSKSMTVGGSTQCHWRRGGCTKNHGPCRGNPLWLPLTKVALVDQLEFLVLGRILVFFSSKKIEHQLWV
ncbi:hypothetical protein PN36_00120 [Candidatus Thiomargarita nelsonii]|uniref:Uncharacterized protein n=1 Tax=Candidatus Thiomargarita nelsonii TaxID=1003181 RepID=A0A0A6PKU2_9GAMM|nr:hypothetical protein PN36_00120 [Candidatus Thiomargarita nelsonii]